jgi:hypothetical protein
MQTLPMLLPEMIAHLGEEWRRRAAVEEGPLPPAMADALNRIEAKGIAPGTDGELNGPPPSSAPTDMAGEDTDPPRKTR